MSKKNKDIEVIVNDSKVTYQGKQANGLSVKIGKKTIAEILPLDNKFAVLKDGTVENLLRTEEEAINQAILNYNLG